jgi:F-type H+-transporting ATPase subunit b
MELIQHFINDPTFWVAVSTVVCFGFIGMKAWRPILAALDGRAASIRLRLDEAEALRNEAQAILEEYKQKSANALNEAKEVLKNAELRAEQMREQMEAELKTAISRQELNAKMRISRLENEAVDAVKTAIIQTTLTRVQDSIANDDDAKDVDASLAAIGKTLH